MKKYPDDINIPGTKIVEMAIHSEEENGEHRTLRGTATVRVNYNLTYHFPETLIQDPEDQKAFMEKRMKRQLEDALESITT